MEKQEYVVPEDVRKRSIIINEEMRWDKNMFHMSDNDKDHVEYIMLPEGVIRSRVERLAPEIVESWQ